MARVVYELESYNRCLCGGCPVNRHSECVSGQEAALSDVFATIETGTPLPDPRIMPGIYCSVGKSACDDLDVRYACLCPGCSIHLRQALRSIHYCLNGSAEETG